MFLSKTLVVAGAILVGLLSSPPAAAERPATLIKAIPVSIETSSKATSVRGWLPRSFSLTGFAPGYAQQRDRGVAIRRIESRSFERLSGETIRELAGVELLRTERGTLTVRWAGKQRASLARWGGLTGRWSIDGASGCYAGWRGHGTFSSDAALIDMHYRGDVIIAS